MEQPRTEDPALRVDPGSWLITAAVVVAAWRWHIDAGLGLDTVAVATAGIGCRVVRSYVRAHPGRPRRRPGHVAAERRAG